MTVTIDDSDASTTAITATATVSGGSYTVSNVDITSLANSYMTVTATAGSATANSSGYLHDKTLPVIRINDDNRWDKNNNNTISGTTDLADGTTITIVVVSNTTATYTTTVWAATGRSARRRAAAAIPRPCPSPSPRRPRPPTSPATSRLRTRRKASRPSVRASR